MIKKNEFTFNEFYGFERLDLELKSVSLNFKGINISEDEAVELLKTNKFVFNNAILRNVKYALTGYFLKYFTSFVNYFSNIKKEDYKEPILLYGINDNGIVKGLPYKGKFPIQNIKKYINKTTLKKLKFNVNFNFNLDNYIL